MNTQNNFTITKVTEDGKKITSIKDFREKIESLDNEYAICEAVIDILPFIQEFLSPLPKNIFFSVYATLLDFYLADNKIPFEEGDNMLREILDMRKAVNDMFPLC